MNNTSLNKNFTLSKLAIATTLILLPAVVNAAKITSIPTGSGTEGFGGYNLENVELILNGTSGAIGSEGTSWFNEEDGTYQFSDDSDFSYVAFVSDENGDIMGQMLAKNYPVGEPSGIKIVHDDFDVSKKKPSNCIISTSYLEDYLLDSDNPIQVPCSGPFQSHKRFKVAMLPTTVADVINGTGPEKSVDLVFNLEAEEGLRDYQVFQKINNWTSSRLEGFTVQVGFGVGSNFETIEDAGVEVANLNISVPSATWKPEQLAVFSAGLFGPLDDHTGEYGFFDDAQRAGFSIAEYVAKDEDVGLGEGVQPLTDILHSAAPLPSNYVDLPTGVPATAYQFGPWLSDDMVPQGVFEDGDNDPSTDADLLAWYGTNAAGELSWMRGIADNFSDLTSAEFDELKETLSYTMSPIEDLVNVGLNYIVTLGDITDYPDYVEGLEPGTGTATFTIRITPTKDTSDMPNPAYMDAVTPNFTFPFSDALVEITPKDEFMIGDLLTARVGDADLNTDAAVIETVDVDIKTDTGLSQKLTLVEQGADRGVFVAALPEEYSNVGQGAKVTITYIDADNSSGDDVELVAWTVAEPQGIFNFAPDAYRITEGEDEGILTLTVTRTAADPASLSREASIDYSTISDTAIGNEDYIPATGTLVFEAGETSKTFAITILDDLTPETDENFSILLSSATNGATIGVSNIASVTIENVEKIGELQFSETSFAANEDDGTATVIINRINGMEGEVSIDVATISGTAIEGDDFVAMTETITFASEETSKMVAITLVNDEWKEDPEFFNVLLSNVQGGATLAPIYNAFVTIADTDESVPVIDEPVIVLTGELQFNQTSYSVAEEDGKAIITIERINGDEGEVTVEVSTLANTAIADDDFTAKTETITFADGQLTANVEIDILNDDLPESAELFYVLLSNAQGATLAPVYNAIVSVTDADPEVVEDPIVDEPIEEDDLFFGELQFETNSYQVSESDEQVVIVVQRVDGLDGKVSVKYSIDGGTAIAGEDYIDNSVALGAGTLIFNEDDTVKYITIPLINDALVNDSVTIEITLNSAQGGATLGEVSKTIVTVSNDDAVVKKDNGGSFNPMFFLVFAAGVLFNRRRKDQAS